MYNAPNSPCCSPGRMLSKVRRQSRHVSDTAASHVGHLGFIVVQHWCDSLAPVAEWPCSILGPRVLQPCCLAEYRWDRLGKLTPRRSVAQICTGVEALVLCRMRVGLPRASVLERFACKDGLAADRKEAASLRDAMSGNDSVLTGARVPDIRIRTEAPSNGHGEHKPGSARLHILDPCALQTTHTQAACSSCCKPVCTACIGLDPGQGCLRSSALDAWSPLASLRWQLPVQAKLRPAALQVS